VTAPGDPSVAVARSVPGVDVYETDKFFQFGAKFNKGWSLESGFDVMGRHGWLAVWDADILWPDSLPLSDLRPTTLYGARRRILDDPTAWHPALDWRALPLRRDGGPIGFTQIFHADAPSLRGKRPWYEVSFSHAAGGDDYFMRHFAPDRRRVLPIEALHLGPCDRHWFGCDAEGKELMAAFVKRNGWRRATEGLPPEAGAGVGEIVERVDVPGYEPTGYQLPFVRRAQAEHG
jgi:hypothetical protein